MEETMKRCMFDAFHALGAPRIPALITAVSTGSSKSLLSRQRNVSSSAGKNSRVH